MAIIETKIGHEILANKSLDYNSLPENRHLDLSLLTSKELIEKAISFERHETININKIYLDRSITDQSHAQEIGKSMKGKRGQLSPILVRARLDEENEVVYDIIDGFHRTLGGIKEGLKTINATVLYGCSDQELYDQRILAANSVKSVQFARLAEWMINSYKNSELPQHINVCQAFALTINDSDRSLNNLKPHEIVDIKEWCIRKAELWQRNPPSIYQDLVLISKSNPELVKEVRNANNGSERLKNLTRGKLESIVERFPGEKNYHLQSLIVNYCIEHRLQRDDVLQLVNNLESQYLSGLTDQRIIQIMESTKIENINKVKIENKRNKTENDKSNRKTERKSKKSELEDIRSQLDQALIVISQKNAEIEELKQDTGSNNESVKNIADKLSNWINNPKINLSENEKKLIKFFLYNSQQINIFRKIKIEQISMVESLLLSAIKKKIVFEDENRHS